MHPALHLMRFDKPIGIWLLFFPAAWAIALAGDSPTHIFYLLPLILVGAAATRAAGCILNDLADRELDAQVARTRMRPLASGQLTRRYALLLLVGLLAIALTIALSLPRAVFFLSLLALPMIAAYPWMKRLTWWPQAFLGLTFNLGVLMGWAATGTPLTLPAFLLYGAAICWTLGYDTIYAVQDMDDDARAGIRSSARAVGLRRLRPFIRMVYGAGFALLMLLGALMPLGLPYYLGLACVLAHGLWQVQSLPPGPARAGLLFRSNQWLGLFLLLGILGDRLL